MYDKAPYFYGTGRRKSSVARVRIYKGTGKVTIGSYFHSGPGCQIITSFHNYEGGAIPYDETYVNKDVNIGDCVWLGNNVIILGYQENIQDIIQQIDLVVLPSYTEGLPLTPIESFAYGKPVVATAAGGTVEIIEDNKNGFLVPIGDVKALTEKIQEVIENESLYKKMCLEAENTYKEKYTFNVFKNKILDYYEQISEERK